MRRCVLIFLLLALLAARGAMAQQDRVSLRESARVAIDAPVRLADVAVLEGEQAEALAQVVVLEDPAGALEGRPWLELDLAEVRAALARAEGSRPARLEFRGVRCAILPLGRTGELRPPPAAPPPAAQGSVEPAEPALLEGPDTVRAQVERELARLLRLSPREMRIAWDDRDGALLNEAIGGRSLQVRLAGRGERTPVAITIYDAERIDRSETVRARIDVLREVALASRAIRRGEAVGDASVRRERRWLSVRFEPAAPATLDGAVARRDIDAGEMIEPHHLEAPILVQRGALCTVHCVAGGIVVEHRNVRARQSGRDGEVIEFETTDGGRRRFTARVSGPGRAVVVASAGEERS